MELDYIEGCDRELYDKFIEINTKNTAVLKGLFLENPLNLELITKLTQEIAISHQAYTESDKTKEYTTAEQFRLVWGHDSIVNGILVDKPEYYTNSSKTGLKYTFAFPIDIDAFDDEFGKNLTEINIPMYKIKVVDFTNFGRDLEFLPKGYELPKKIEKLGNFCSKMPKLLHPFDLTDTYVEYFENYGMNFKTGKYLTVPRYLNHLGNFGKALKSIRPALLNVLENKVETYTFGANLVKMTAKLYDIAHHKLKTFGDFGKNVSVANESFTLNPDNMDYTLFMSNFEEIPKYARNHPNAEGIARRWSAKNQKWVQTEPCSGHDEPHTRDIITCMTTFVRHYGEDSIKGGVLYDNEAYYTDGTKTEFKEIFTIPEGVTKLVGVGEFVKNANRSKKYDEYGCSLDYDNPFTLPKSLVDVGVFGKSLTWPIYSLVIHHNLENIHRFETNGKNIITIEGQEPLVQGNTYKLYESDMKYTWIKGGLSEEDKFEPFINNIATIKITTRDWAIYVSEREEGTRVLLSANNSSEYKNRWNEGQPMPNHYTIPEGIHDINARWYYTSWCDTFRLPSTIKSIGKLGQYVSHMNRGFNLIVPMTTLGKFGENLRHIPGDLTYPKGLTHMGTFGERANTIDDDYVLPVGITHLGRFGANLLTLPKNFIIPDTVVDLGDFGRSLTSIPEWLVLPDSIIDMGGFGLSVTQLYKGFTLPKNVELLRHFGASLETLEEDFVLPQSVRELGSFGRKLPFRTLDFTKYPNITHMDYYSEASEEESMGDTPWVYPANVIKLGWQSNITTTHPLFKIPNTVTHLENFGASFTTWPKYLVLPKGLIRLGRFGWQFKSVEKHHILPDTIIDIEDYMVNATIFPVGIHIPKSVTVLKGLTMVRTAPKRLIIPQGVVDISQWVPRVKTFKDGTVLHKGLQPNDKLSYYNRPYWYKSELFANNEYDIKLEVKRGEDTWHYGAYDWDTGEFVINTDMEPLKFET